MAARFEIKVRKPEGAVTGQLGECVEILIGNLRVGHIMFVRHGKNVLEIVGGNLEAPYFVARTAGASATPNQSDEPDDSESDDDEDEAESEAATKAAERAEKEQKERAKAAAAAADIAAKRMKATRAIIGPEANILASAGQIELIGDDGEPVAGGTNWEQAFKRALRSLGVWERALLTLCIKQKAAAYIRKSVLTRTGLAQLRSMPGVVETTVSVTKAGGDVEDVDSLVLRRSAA